MTDTATRFVMEFYDIDEETAARLYSDEIEAAQNLLKHEEFKECIQEKADADRLSHLGSKE
jgi:hypothetical protein